MFDRFTTASQLTYRQNAWNDIQCSNKCGKACYVKTLHVSIANGTNKIQSFDWPKWHCALRRYIISHHLLDKTSFQMVQQMICRYVNNKHKSAISMSHIVVPNCQHQKYLSKQPPVDLPSSVYRTGTWTRDGNPCLGSVSRGPRRDTHTSCCSPLSGFVLGQAQLGNAEFILCQMSLFVNSDIFAVIIPILRFSCIVRLCSCLGLIVKFRVKSYIKWFTVELIQKIGCHWQSNEMLHYHSIRFFCCG